MWGVPVPQDIVGSERLMAFFGTDEVVVPGRIYGSIEEGTARVLHQPPVIHPGDHHSRTAIGRAVDWFQATLEGGTDIPSSNQIWYWKELGTLLALVGMVLLLLSVGTYLLRTPWFRELAGEPGEPAPATGLGWAVAAVVFVLLPPITFFPFKDVASSLGLSPSWVFPQGVTNQIVTWTTLLGLISLVLFLVWHWASNRKRGATARHYGLTWGEDSSRVSGGWFGRVGKSFVVAFLVVLAGYLAVRTSAFFFRSDFRLWVFAARPMSRAQTGIALSYGLPFLGFFLALATVLHGQLRRGGQTFTRELAMNVVLLTVGFVGLLLLQYVPLLTGGTLAIPSEPLWTIIAFQLLPIMTIVAVVSTFFYRRTGHVYVGAFASGILTTWIVVASQATHFAR
jgi:hypothetical protein